MDDISSSEHEESSLDLSSDELYRWQQDWSVWKPCRQPSQYSPAPSTVLADDFEAKQRPPALYEFRMRTLSSCFQEDLYGRSVVVPPSVEEVVQETFYTDEWEAENLPSWLRRSERREAERARVAKRKGAGGALGSASSLGKKFASGGVGNKKPPSNEDGDGSAGPLPLDPWDERALKIKNHATKRGVPVTEQLSLLNIERRRYMTLEMRLWRPPNKDVKDTLDPEVKNDTNYAQLPYEWREMDLGKKFRSRWVPHYAPAGTGGERWQKPNRDCKVCMEEARPGWWTTEHVLEEKDAGIPTVELWRDWFCKEACIDFEKVLWRNFHRKGDGHDDPEEMKRDHDKIMAAKRARSRLRKARKHAAELAAEEKSEGRAAKLLARAESGATEGDSSSSDEDANSALGTSEEEQRMREQEEKDRYDGNYSDSEVDFGDRCPTPPSFTVQFERAHNEFFVENLQQVLSSFHPDDVHEYREAKEKLRKDVRRSLPEDSMKRDVMRRGKALSNYFFNGFSPAMEQFLESRGLLKNADGSPAKAKTSSAASGGGLQLPAVAGAGTTAKNALEAKIESALKKKELQKDEHGNFIDPKKEERPPPDWGDSDDEHLDWLHRTKPHLPPKFTNETATLSDLWDRLARSDLKFPRRKSDAVRKSKAAQRAAAAGAGDESLPSLAVVGESSDNGAKKTFKPGQDTRVAAGDEDKFSLWEDWDTLWPGPDEDFKTDTVKVRMRCLGRGETEDFRFFSRSLKIIHVAE